VIDWLLNKAAGQARSNNLRLNLIARLHTSEGCCVYTYHCIINQLINSLNGIGIVYMQLPHLGFSCSCVATAGCFILPYPESNQHGKAMIPDCKDTECCYFLLLGHCSNRVQEECILQHPTKT